MDFKNQQKVVKWIKFSGIISIILVILNSGIMFAFISNETIDLIKFSFFIENLNSWIIKNKNFKFAETLILLTIDLFTRVNYQKYNYER